MVVTRNPGARHGDERETASRQYGELVEYGSSVSLLKVTRATSDDIRDSEWKVGLSTFPETVVPLPFSWDGAVA